MFIIALFMSVGLFASASNLKEKEPTFKSSKKVKKYKKVKPVKNLVGDWMIVYECGPGSSPINGGSICCFNTYQEAATYIASGALTDKCDPLCGWD